jgi:hypothetical protein
MAMFGSDILSREKPPTMIDNSALCLGKEESDTLGKSLKGGGLGPTPDAGR